MNVNHARIQFFDELKDFLHTNKESISVEFKGRQSIKHIIESLGVPHTEVDQIFVNRQPQSLTYIVEDNDDIKVFPWRLVPDRWSKILLNPCFILDNHLGKLSNYLRILGFDCMYRNNLQDDEIVSNIRKDERILLTRDRKLLMRRDVRWGYCVRQDDPRQQLVEVVSRFRLQDKIKPLSRCLNCNQLLKPIDKLSIIHRLEPLTKLYFEEFHICPYCDQIYWKGSHYDHMLDFIKQIREGDY